VTDISLSRRRLLAGASATTALGLFGGTSLTQAKAPMLNAPAPAFYRFKLGTIEATVVSDGPLSIGDPKNTFRGPTAEELGKMMSDQFLPTNNVVLDQNVLVINTGDKLALFETGMSSVKRNEDMGRLIANLKQSGIDPKDIDAVIPTHAHIDHIGGIMAADGSRNFPNAQIYISQADLEFWTDDKRLGTPAEGSALAARKNLIPNRDRIVFYKDGQEVLPGVQAMHTPGHTVGHTSFVVNSGNKSLLVVGDLVHHVILVEKPHMEVGFDTDPKQGGSREAIAKLPTRVPGPALSPPRAAFGMNCRNALSARQHLDQPIQIFLAIEERLHQHAFVFAVHTHIVDIAGEPGMAVSGYAGIAQVAAIRRAGAHDGNDRCSRPKLGGKFCDRTQDLLM
jgi:glyoxylase-like metal-dependent hydrolase (beta-lactamase superfamily II)